MSTKPEPEVDSLRREREADIFPFSRSPFRHGFVPGGDADSQEVTDLAEGELRVRSPEEVPWIDLLLEIAMTTAFASLTDGTPILQWDNALSYVIYFAFVWWIWASQVAYNMRFRQADWLHRIWVFVQLVVFSALATFTKDFNITNGLSSNSDSAQADQLRSQLLGSDNSDLAANKYREDRLPRLNAQGVSMVMAMSRLVLLVQYSVVFYHAKHLKRKSTLVHMVPLFFSALCYLAAFVILSTGDTKVEPSKAVSSVKLVLWLFPILVEIASHYVALHLPGFVRYSTESIYARSGTVFLIILGAGLDKITGGFKFIVGNAGLGANGIPIFVAASVIFIGLFSLYFATPGSTRGLGNKRALTWFFSQFFFLSALIITLEGIATAVQFANIFAAIGNVEGALYPLITWQEEHPGVNLTSSTFNATTEDLFRKLGVSLDTVILDINDYVTISGQEDDSDILVSGSSQLEITLVNQVLYYFEAAPEFNSLLWLKLVTFLDADVTDTEAFTDEKYYDIWDSIIRDRGSSALWFYPAAGATILALVLMSFAKGLPRDKWEWRVITSRLVVGGVILLLAFLNFGSSKPVVDKTGVFTNSPIWIIALSSAHWLLIILAVAMAILQLVERFIAYMANRSYYNFNNINFLNGAGRRSQTQLGPQYEAKANDSGTMSSTPFEYPYSKQLVGQGPIYTEDPYDPYKELVKTQYSPGR